MTDKKGLGSKILGVFVESADGAEGDASAEAGKSPADIVAELARGSTGAPPGRKLEPPAPPPSNLKLERAVAGPGAAAPADFDTIFRDAGMDASELDRVHKAEELLKSLPDSTPQPVKKQIVEASLKAFGFEIEKILLAAQNQTRALDAYVRVNEAATAKAITDDEAQIRQLTDKITALRADIERRTATLTTVSTAAQGRKNDVQKVIGFFETK